MTRFIPKQFAENSTTSVVFGSHQEQGGNVGDGTISSDPATLQGGTAWQLGWKAATDNFFQIPRGEEMEGLERVLSAAIIQQFKDGLTFWQPEMPVTQYQTIVQYQTGSDRPKLYINITGTSTSTPPDSDTTNWYMFLDTAQVLANSNASNFSQAGRSYLSGLGMPSNRYIDLTLGASGSTYTAPANGYIQVSKFSSGVGQALNISIEKFYTGTEVSDAAFIIWSTRASHPLALTVPLLKGDKFFVYYDLGGVTNTFKFIYAEGEN